MEISDKIISPNDTMQVEVQNDIARVSFNRAAQLNALNDEMVEAATTIFKAIKTDKSIRCVLLSGTGDHFMAGGDIRKFKDVIDTSPNKPDVSEYFQNLLNDMHDVILEIRHLSIPVIACVKGGVAGAGVSFALACDMIIASENAFFTLAYCHLGVSPDGGSTFSLPRIVGMKRAFEIALLGDRFDAKTAQQWGLVNFVVPDDQLELEAGKLMTRLANGPSVAYAQNKELLNMTFDNDLETQLRHETARFAKCTTTNDFEEGLNAFIDKRKPQFSGN